ncbi:Ankyrin repeat domain-containing protein 13B [Triplophysa tibetana]|uniref:Ankyrin repeat domain-containing protein 13B n=1 Tax=Triplophysa tibetana TaxID=1572043 RepID=A0A5A9MYK3_9TELE|nr:Ankyrin repeat domain-containing protein 13B [Triplophysa tibetana]
MISARKTPEKSRFHLHYLVWHNKHRQLEKQLSAREQCHKTLTGRKWTDESLEEKERENGECEWIGGLNEEAGEEHCRVDLEVLDPRGRTPLHLAVTLGHLDCARLLLQHGADVCKENRNGWTVLQEAISTRDPELIRLALGYRDYQRTTKRLAGIPRLLERLRQTQDFYVEMKWEFTSWVPLVSRICPSDTYRVWKSGQCLRVDTTLMGFEQMTWQRGNRSFIFKGQASPSSRLCTNALSLLGAPQPSDEQVAARLSAPVVATQLDTRNISFERNKTGILSWRSEKTETVNGYESKVMPESKVYCASNVELITRTRTDHLTDQHKTKAKEIPIYHILNARITFGNLNGCEEGGLPRVDGEGDGQKESPRTETPSPGSDSSSVSSSSSTNSCRGGEIPACVFEAPRGYSMLGGNQRQNIREEEDDLLQYAIQQSLIEAGSEFDQVTIWEALTNSKPGTHNLSSDPSRLERSAVSIPLLLSPVDTSHPQQTATPITLTGDIDITLTGDIDTGLNVNTVQCEAHRYSLRTPQHKPSSAESPRGTPTNKPPRSYNEQLRLAMELSAREQEEAELRKRREEEELQRIIQLSLMEK